jgi:uncharacterized protein
MNFTEHALSFACAGEELLGIVTAPEQPKPTGVLIVVGGPQYRVGSHRQFLLLARALAKAGYPVMRFDYRGMGDSTGDLRDFEVVNDDIAAAIDAFRVRCPDVFKIVLCGLCDAASASLLYWDATRDSKISGLILLNPWVRSEITLARTHVKYYYGKRLLQAEFWRKLLTGKIGLTQAIRGFIFSVRNACQANFENLQDPRIFFQQRMARGLWNFTGPVLLILSGNDYTAKEFLEHCKDDFDCLNALNDQKITMVEISGADHTFSSVEWHRRVETLTIEWLNKDDINRNSNFAFGLPLIV